MEGQGLDGEDNIRMDLEEIGINAGNWVESAQDRDYWKTLVIAPLKLLVPLAMVLVSLYIMPLRGIINIPRQTFQFQLGIESYTSSSLD